jgi:hypothetical protein
MLGLKIITTVVDNQLLINQKETVPKISHSSTDIIAFHALNLSILTLRTSNAKSVQTINLSVQSKNNVLMPAY